MSSTWESMISLNSEVEPSFTLLHPPKAYYDPAIHSAADIAAAVDRDTYPLPETADREGYHGSKHFDYWLSGHEDANRLIRAASQYGVHINRFLDFGCASGRVIRHLALELPKAEILGCDINRLHVEWCNSHLPPNCTVFQNHSIPSLPLEDNSIDMVSAFSVFTHIEGFETSWLMELRRVLRPGGLAWITVHSEGTMRDMDETWPLWSPVMKHPNAAPLKESRDFSGDRFVARWHNDRSYASNVFYKQNYMENTWRRIMDVLEFNRRCPSYQDVILMQKRVRSGNDGE